jgi:hypothetical protein
MSVRTYVVFGSDDKVNWEQLGPVQAGGAPQALRKAIAKEKHRHYFTVPERNITAVTPETEERPPLVRLTPMTPGQLSIQDAVSGE